MAAIPKVLHEHINTACPAHVCLVATVLPNGFAQVSPCGSTMVFDDEHLGLWERGKGSTNANLKDGTAPGVRSPAEGRHRPLLRDRHDPPEELIQAHPDLVEAAAIGVPSELSEDDIKVAAIARPGAGLEAPALAGWLAERLPQYMTVRYVELVDDLPRTDTQKVMKTALRARWRTPGTWDAEQARDLPEEHP